MVNCNKKLSCHTINLAINYLFNQKGKFLRIKPKIEREIIQKVPCGMLQPLNLIKMNLYCT